MAKKILLIDDHPDDEFQTGKGEGGYQELQQILFDLFSSQYEVIVEEDPKKAEVMVEEDKDIDVILLDIEFNDNPLGKEIARNLETINPDARVVVLTQIDRKGNRIVFGQRSNVWYYFVKQNLKESVGRTELKGIVSALMEDPFNEKWSMTFDGETVELNHPDLNKPIDIAIGNNDQAVTLEHCLTAPNQCHNYGDIEGRTPAYQLTRVVSQLNAKFIQKTDFRTWGFLDSKRCVNNSLKISVGENNTISNEKRSSLEEQILLLQKEMAALKQRVVELEERV